MFFAGVLVMNFGHYNLTNQLNLFLEIACIRSCYASDTIRMKLFLGGHPFVYSLHTKTQR